MSCGILESEESEKDYVDCKWIGEYWSYPVLEWTAWVRSGYTAPSKYTLVINDTYKWIHLYKNAKSAEMKKPNGEIFTYQFTGSYSYGEL